MHWNSSESMAQMGREAQSTQHTGLVLCPLRGLTLEKEDLQDRVKRRTARLNPRKWRTDSETVEEDGERVDGTQEGHKV